MNIVAQFCLTLPQASRASFSRQHHIFSCQQTEQNTRQQTTSYQPEVDEVMERREGNVQAIEQRVQQK